MIEPEKQDLSEEILNLNEEDRQILLSLLQEYTEKLTDICSKIEDQIKFCRDFMMLCYFIGIVGILAIVATNFHPLILFFVIAFSFVILGIFVFILVFINAPQTKIKILKNNGINLAIKLKRLVRTTSQFQENIEKTYVRKIQLDLRLADAESALLYHQTVEDKLRKLSPLLRILLK